MGWMTNTYYISKIKATREHKEIFISFFCKVFRRDIHNFESENASTKTIDDTDELFADSYESYDLLSRKSRGWNHFLRDIPLSDRIE